MTREKAATGGQSLTPEEVDAAFLEVINAAMAEVAEAKELEGLDAGLRDYVKDKVRASINAVIASSFKFDLPDGAEERLFDLAVEYLTRQSLKDFTSGVVIAGFGDDEYMPAVASFEVEESAGSLARRTPISVARITGCGSRAFVMPYAQRDSVFHFLFGVDSDISGFMQESVRSMTNGLVDVVLEKVGQTNAGLADGLRDPIKTVVGDKLKDLFGAWNNEQGKYLRPVLDTVASLPKDELAAMAESLVNLTKFRRRVTPVAETVSGPIDVAVITKGDGFVWIRRKHYFAPEINPRIMARFHNPGGGP